MKVASFAFTTPNLGDDLQVMAAVRHLPRVDRLVDRDFMGEHRLPEQHAVVMNSWFQLGRRHPHFPYLKRRDLAPSQAYQPIFHGFCVGSDKILKRGWTEYLRARQPIGCRDVGSAEKLQSLGIDSYWSGCLTLTLGDNLPRIPAGERKGVYLVDLPPEVEKEFVPAEISRQAIRLSNETPKAIVNDPLARMNFIARICDRLRHAELVVTRRLHTALPCVAFGTPVVVFVETHPNNTRRFSGYDRFIPVSFRGGGAKPRVIEWSDRTPPELPEQLRRALDGFAGAVRQKLGEGPRTAYDKMTAKSLLTLPNPGLGWKPGEVALNLGRFRVARLPKSWSDKEITVEIEHFAGFERFNSPILARQPGKVEWVDLGPVSSYLKNAEPQ